MSPTPLTREKDPTGKLLIGTMVRAITFTFLFRANGMTGWKFKLSADRASRSPPELKLNCSGTETRFATGFCVCFAKLIHVRRRRLLSTRGHNQSEHEQPDGRGKSVHGWTWGNRKTEGSEIGEFNLQFPNSPIPQFHLHASETERDSAARLDWCE
jgi:hypothetical protein